MRRRLPSRFVPLLLALIVYSCNDDPPPTGNQPPTTTTAPAASANGSLRGAQLSEDARSVDFVVNGAALATGIDYGGVGPYAELAPGDYRVQFFPEGVRTTPIIETLLNLGSNQLVTVAIVGESSTTISIVHERSTRSDRARLTLVNTVPDFPAPFDLAIQNGPGLFGGVGYLQTSGTAELIPGVYGFELRRGGTAEEVAVIEGQALSSGANYTIWAFGTLSRDNIELLVTRDSF
jgi:Domain of unknown function (DUF4397)